MMRPARLLAVAAATLCPPLWLHAEEAQAPQAQARPAQAQPAQPQPAPSEATQARSEQVQSDVSMREISIQSNFSGIEIVLFGAIDFSRAPSPDEAPYDVIMVVRGPSQPLVVRRKQRVAGLWVNGSAETFSAVPGFYAVLASRPLRAVASEATLKSLGIGFANVDLGTSDEGDRAEDGFRAAMIALRQQHELFREEDDAVSFIGRSLFRGSVDLPVNTPIGLYTTQIYLFRDGKLRGESQGSLQVQKVGFERVVYLLAFRHPFLYGLLAVVIAVAAGLVAWALFRKE
jgi:uncharacterized protein (TIGR02186 family)